MKLPRYSSSALPREQTLSPQEAGAASAAWGQAGAQVAGLASEFAYKMYQATQQAASDKALLTAQMQVQERVTRNPQLDKPTTDPVMDATGTRVVEEAKPTEEWVATEWGQLEKDLSSLTTDLKGPYKKATEAKIEEMKFEARMVVAEKLDKIAITRAKNTSTDALEMAWAAGDFGTGEQIIQNAADAGLLTPAERQARISENDLRRSLYPGVLAVRSQNPDAIAKAAFAILDNKDIPPDKAMEAYKALLAVRQEILDNESLDPKYEERYLELLPGAVEGSLSLRGLIQEHSNLSPKRFDQLTGIIRARSDNKAGGSMTNSAGQAEIDRITRDMLTFGLRDETIPYAEALQNAETQLLSNPNIAIEDAQKAIENLRKVAKLQRDNPQYSDLLDVVKAEMTGITRTGTYVVSKDTRAEVIAYQTLEQEFYAAAAQQGPRFDPQEWLAQKAPGARMRAFKGTAEKQGWAPLVKYGPDGAVDVPATEEALERWAQEAKTMPGLTDQQRQAEIADRDRRNERAFDALDKIKGVK